MRYRLLCCSDTHGQIPPALDELNALAWLHGGDVCNAPDVVDADSNPFNDFLLAPVANWFKDRPIPVHLVRGNHDVSDVYQAFRNCGDLTGRIVKLAEHLFVAGIGWHGERYFELPRERDLEPICQQVVRQSLRSLFSKDRLILLTHYPPRFVGTHDVPNDKDGGGVWYDCVRSVVELLEPIAVVQGHNHRWFGATHQIKLANRSTVVLNPGPAGCVLEVDLEQDCVRLA